MGDQFQNVCSCDAIDKHDMRTLMIDVLVALLTFGGLYVSTVKDASKMHRSRYQMFFSLSGLSGTSNSRASCTRLGLLSPP